MKKRNITALSLHQYYNSTQPAHRKKILKIPKGDNQNLLIEEEQTTQWSKEKVQKDKQRSIKHTHKTKDRVTRIPLKTRAHDYWTLCCTYRL